MHDNGGMPLVARRIAAGLAAVSAALHTVMLGHAGNVASTVLIAVMAVVCLYCARELWPVSYTHLTLPTTPYV